MELQHICVFCGSNFGDDELYRETARHVGQTLAARDIGLVYGGGNRGLMGEVARTMKEAGAHIIGVSPKRFHRPESVPFTVDEYIIVDTMHQRKATMYSKADAFIALPGGIGTLEELAEITTWRQIGFTNKPTALLNIHGFYNPLLDLLESMYRHGFTREDQWKQLIVSDSIEEILDIFTNYTYEKALWENWTNV